MYLHNLFTYSQFVIFIEIRLFLLSPNSVSSANTFTDLCFDTTLLIHVAN